MLRFADLIEAANNEDVHVSSIAGPVPGSLLEHYEMRALAVGGNSDGTVAVVGLDRYGASAPYQRIYEELGLTGKAVAAAARRVLAGLRPGGGAETM